MDKKKILQGVFFAVAILFNVFGIMSLLTISKIAPIGFLGFYNNVRLLVRYIILILIMTAGIMTFSTTAGTLSGKKKNVLSIGITTYSTVLTLPLLLTFILCFFAMNNPTMPFAGEICVEFMDIFKSTTVQYLIFAGGIVLSIIFLAVPILSCVQTVKKKEAKE